MHRQHNTRAAAYCVLTSCMPTQYPPCQSTPLLPSCSAVCLAAAALLLLLQGAVVLGMIGFSYASVPLYRAFCQATGYGGAVGKAHNIEAKLKAREEQPNPSLEEKCAKREIRVWFSSDVADDMPWSFKPTQEYVTVHPGDSTLAFFTAHNKR